MTSIKCDKCGKDSRYPENKQGQILCSSCAMAHDYAKASAERNPSLFN